MTIPPFTARRGDRAAASAHLAGASPVIGTFPSPRGSRGTFAGTYRLERLVNQYGQTAAAGIFSGELTDGDGRHLGVGSCRHTAAAELTSEPDAFRTHLGPLDVNLLGFLVTVNEFSITVPRGLPSTTSAPEAPPVRAIDLLRQVATAADERQTRDGSD